MPPKPRKPPPRKRSANRNLLVAAGAAAAVVLVLVGASLLLRGGDSNDTAAERGEVTGIEEAATLLDGIPQDRAVLGSPKAKVTMIQFEDLQCPICRRYQAEGFPSVVGGLRPAGQGEAPLRRDGVPRARLGEGAALHACRGGAGQAVAVPGCAVREPGRRELRLGHGRAPREDRKGPRASTGRSSRRTRTAP